MRLIYVANVRLPTHKAHGVQIVKTCESLANQGLELELVIPGYLGSSLLDIFDYYNIERNFSVKRIKHPNFISLGRFGFYLNFFIFNFSVAIWLAYRKMYKKEKMIIYSRGEPVLFLGPVLANFLPFFWESHEKPKEKFIAFYRFACRNIKGMVTVTEYYKNEILNDIGFSKNVLCAPDGVDVEKFDLSITREGARVKVGLPLDRKIVVYSGSFFLYDWKGVDILLESKKYLPKECLIVLIGGQAKEITTRGYDLDNVVVIPPVNHTLIPVYLKAADVLILPNKKGQVVSEFYTSPVKLFEYMASGVPIVASNLSSMREILNENNAILVEPNSPAKLADGIQEIIANSKKGDALAKQARLDVNQYAWKKRAQKIISLLLN